MKQLIRTLVFLFLFAFSKSSYSQKVVWVKDMQHIPGLPSSVPGHALQVVTDRFSNVYFLSLAGGPTITKLGNAGNLIWVKQILISYAGASAFYEDNTYSIDVDSNGDIYLSGMFDQNPNDFDPGPAVVDLVAAGYSDLFIEKLDSAGNFQWIKQLGGVENDRCGSMKVDKQDNVIFTGRVWGTVNFDPGPGQYNSTGFTDDMFICKVSGTGGLINFTRIGQASDKSIQPMSLTIDPFNNIVITGVYFSYSNNIDFDPGAGTSYLTPGNATGRLNGFILKLGTNFDFKWAKQISNTGSSTDPVYSNSIKTDLSGNIYLAGMFSAVIDADPGPATHLLTPIASSDLFIIKLNSNGVFSFAKQIGTGDFVLAFLTVDNASNIFLTGRNVQATDFDPGPGTAIFSPVPAGSSTGFILKLNSQGEYLWYNHFRNSAGVVVGKAIAVDSSNFIYASGDFDSQLYFGTTYLGLLPIQSPDVYISKLGDANNIQGTAFYDLNANGIKEANENVLQGVIVKAVSPVKSYLGITDARGLYNITVDTGTYNITIPQLPAYYSSSVPASQSSVFSYMLGKIDSLNNFGLVPVQNRNDLKINITNVTYSRTGHSTIYRLTYKNVGTTTLSGTITLTHATLLSFVNSNPAAAGYTAPVITWNFSNLNPSATGNIDITFNVAPTALLGTVLQSVAVINPVATDQTPANNDDTLIDVVRSAYDPNGKYVVPANNFFSDFISQGQYLDYTIRFQNTGTDTAFNITIRDTLDNLLDVNSFELISTSHTCSTSLLGTGVLEWKFANILLPDSNQNEPKSHGYVRFRIKPKNSIQVGNQIKNTGYIGFDYNPYIVTNQTTNTYAATYISAANGNWNNPATWLGGVVPPAGAKVIVRHQVNANINTSCYSLTVEMGTGLLTVKTGVTLIVTN